MMSAPHPSASSWLMTSFRQMGYGQMGIHSRFMTPIAHQNNNVQGLRRFLICIFVVDTLPVPYPHTRGLRSDSQQEAPPPAYPGGMQGTCELDFADVALPVPLPTPPSSPLNPYMHGVAWPMLPVQRSKVLGIETEQRSHPP